MRLMTTLYGNISPRGVNEYLFGETLLLSFVSTNKTYIIIL